VGPQRQANLFSPGSVIDARKYRHALCFYGGLEACAQYPAAAKLLCMVVSPSVAIACIPHNPRVALCAMT